MNNKHGHEQQRTQRSGGVHLSHLPPELNRAHVESAKAAEDDLMDEPVQQHLEKPRRYPRKKADRHTGA